MRKVLFLDIETTGLIASKDYIWQVAFIKGVEDAKTLLLVEGKERLLLPIGKKTPRRLSFLAKELQGADILVAHNNAFERAFLESYGLDIQAKTFCTMLESTELCRIEHDFYGYKWPRLDEAVEMLLSIPVDYHKLHDARYDVLLTAKLYAHLKGLDVEDSNLKWHTAPRALKLLFGFVFSPIDPYKSMRRKLHPRRIWERVKERLKREEVPF